MKIVKENVDGDMVLGSYGRISSGQHYTYYEIEFDKELLLAFFNSMTFSSGAAVENLDTMLFSKYLDIANYLKTGKNTVKLVLSTNNRNLMGPHHVSTAEPLSVGPKTFSLEGMWHGAECQHYVPDHAFVKFGINV